MDATRWIAALVAVLAAALLPACAEMKVGQEAAQRKVQEFHALLNESRFEDIYETSSDDLRKATSKEKLVALLTAVHRKLGNVTGTNNKGWRVNNFNLRTSVVLVQETTFETGKAIETFTYAVQGGKASLLGYNIQSDDLITR